jgi:hypothetical protein
VLIPQIWSVKTVYLYVWSFRIYLGPCHSFSLFQVALTDACGFCGQAPSCPVYLKVQDKKTKIISSCTHFYDVYSYKTASKSSGTKPCTNVPVICPVCDPAPDGERKRQAIWKYNLEDHFRASHPDFATPGWPARYISPSHSARLASTGCKTVHPFIAQDLDFDTEEESRLDVSVSHKWSYLGSLNNSTATTTITGMHLDHITPEAVSYTRPAKRQRL